MITYNTKPKFYINPKEGIKIASFLNNDKNVDLKTIESFGFEWDNFHGFSDAEIDFIGNEYFDIVDFKKINKNCVALDVGCGSGRWTKFLSDKVKFIEAIDPSSAVLAAVSLLKDVDNVRVSQAGVDSIPFHDESFDFVFSLGVLHHIPDTFKAMQSCINKLKPNGYFLVYLYYSLDNRGALYKFIFRLINLLRKVISIMPNKLKKLLTDILAVLIYFPLANMSKGLKYFTKSDLYKKIPLSYYHDKTFYVMRNDAYDRFATPLEQRFSRDEIISMMKNCGLDDIICSESTPYWHAIGKKVK